MSLLSSMTGFARIEGSHDQLSWVWEARSVNGKTLDVRWRLPQGLSALEGKGRKAFEAQLSRGNIQASLTLKRDKTASAYSVDQVWLDTLSAISSGAPGMSDPSHLPQLMQVEGVVRPIDVTEQALSDDVQAALMESLSDLIASLVATRREEGKALLSMLSSAVDGIERLTSKAQNSADAQTPAIKARLERKLAELLDDKIEPERLAQEAAYLAVKADIREELDRLSAHIDQARTLLAQGSPIGRKLEFLAQEFNREINTICSKSASVELTQIGLSLKSVNEQFREQSANVE